MSNAEIFIEKYKQLEEAVRFAYNLRNEDSVAYYLSRSDKYKNHVNEIKYCKEVRNLLSHKKKINDQFAVEPNDEMIKFIDELIAKVKNRAKCNQIGVDISRVYWRRLDSSVKETAKVMSEKNYSHVPILDSKGVVIGVFGSYSVIGCMADDSASLTDENLKFSDITEHVLLDFIDKDRYLFVGGDLYADELEKIIEKEIKQGVRTKLIFVTQNGDRNQKLQGIITPWNMINI